MREIEFRGKLGSGEWVYGNLIRSLDGRVMIKPFPQVFRGEATEFEVIPETVGQFTGLMIHKVKIYDGDIVEGTEEEFDGGYLVSRSTYVGKVFWDWKNGWWAVEDMPSGDEYPLYDYVFDRVIGNIVDYPDFFKGWYQGEDDEE